ncbi:class I SAM-dependent methyltransferase [Aggregatilinea lenta]|uniref:class I SAM-dependent methyltransferase n=1 Tax=Aggregatilinea lenta TaxID=913108 RepID=UPI001EE95928|nr:class I SAM-dependent methyltransferase [Aggregatilinea lenta]
MDERDARFLLGSAGQAALAQLAAEDLDERYTLALLDRLRQTLSPGEAGAALTTARLRQRAAAKFSRAASMVFTPDALEQASGEAVSRWRARRFTDLGAARIADLGCGVGGDLLALAAVPGASAVGVDLDPVRLLLASANLDANGLSASLVRADLLDPLPLAGVPAAFFDPARRAAGRRIFSVRDYHPPLDVIRAWPFEALAVKLSPGVDLGELWPYTAAGAGIEFVSAGGELKEAVLWTGAWGFAGCRASRVEPDGSGASLEPRGLPAPPLAEPGAVLYEPDPAIIRAGLLAELGAELGAPVTRLDESIAYLTADALVESSWARAWPVWDWMPFNLKRLRAALRARGVGRVTVKKRGSPIAPEDLIRQLKLDGQGESAVVVLTRVAGQHTALICGERL